MANRYWVATSTGNWNDTANWSTSSGGSGGASVPGPSDAAIFNSSKNGNCTVDINVSVASFQMEAFYEGVVSFGSYNLTCPGACYSATKYYDGVRGILKLGSGSHVIGGSSVSNFGDEGRIAGETSTVTFSGNGTVSIWFDNSYYGSYLYNVVLAAGKTHQVKSANILQVKGTLSSLGTGVSNAILTSYSGTPGTIDVQGTANIGSGNTVSNITATTNPIYAGGSTDGGGNTNVIFAVTQDLFPTGFLNVNAVGSPIVDREEPAMSGTGNLTHTAKPRYPVLDINKKLGRAFSCWPFHDGGGNYLLDISKNYRHGEIKAFEPQKLWTDGTLERSITGKAMTFDGSLDCVVLDGSSIPESGDVSISLWFNPTLGVTSSLSEDIYLFRSEDATSTNGIRIFFSKSHTSPDGRLNFWVHDGNVVGTYGKAWSDSSTWLSGTWYHIVGTYRAETKSAKIYINGTIQSTIATLSSGRGTVLSADAYIGAYDEAGTYGNFPGIIDNIVVYNTEISSTEVTTINTDPLYHLSTEDRSVISTSSDFRLTRNKIIERALRMVGATDTGEIPSGNQYGEAAEALNNLVQEIQAEGIALWATEWVTHPVESSMLVNGTDGSVYSCIREHTATIDNRPVDGKNWSTYWYKRGTTGTTWSVNGKYRSAGDFECDIDTIGIESAFVRRDNKDDIPLTIIRRQDYFLSVANKYYEGLPSCLFYDSGVVPRITLWPQPDTVGDVIHYMRIKKLKDFTTGSDNADAPDKFGNVLVYGLASMLADEYTIPISERAYLASRFEKAKVKIRSSGFEPSCVRGVRSAYR